MGGAWLNGAESRIALERRRGAEGHTEADGGETGGVGGYEGGPLFRPFPPPVGKKKEGAGRKGEGESCLGAIN